MRRCIIGGKGGGWYGGSPTEIAHEWGGGLKGGFSDRLYTQMTCASARNHDIILTFHSSPPGFFCSFVNRTMPEAGRIRAVLADALDVWARISVLSFRETYDDEADIRVMFVR